MEKRWIFQNPPKRQTSKLIKELNLHPYVAGALVLRGHDDTLKAEKFLSPKLSSLPQPDSMCDVLKAASIVADEMEKGTAICIYGDYDLDGISSTSLLVEFFRQIGYPVQYRLPDRLTEGYGFHASVVDELAASKVGLIITVDCGISSHEACIQAKKNGQKVIVSDHHEILGDLPDADAIVDPHRPECGFKEEHLAGVGIAFFLAAAIKKELVKRKKLDPALVDMRSFLDLVALGTVADVAPILGINRNLIAYGLELITNNTRPGVTALRHAAGLGDRKILCGHISFQLAPRINAAGRVGNASLGVELLTSQDERRVAEIARILDEENKNRQQIEAEILEQARQNHLDNPHHHELYSIVLAGKGWHPGVVGICASRMQEEFYRPTILVSLQGEKGRGSARSISGFNIFEAIDACSEHLEEFGGHKYAAGIQILPENLAPFAIAFEKEARSKLTEDDLIPTISVDGECDLDRIDQKMIKDLSRISPFGVGNPEPVFVTRDAEVIFKKVVGGSHLKLRLAKKRDAISAIAFGMGDMIDAIGQRVDIAYSVSYNEFMGNGEIQLTVKDLKII